MTPDAGDLLHSKVVPDPGDVLGRALADAVTGYATVEPQDALLLDADGVGVLAFDRGIPVAARHTGTGRVGREALAELSVPGPCRIQLYATDRPPQFAGESRARIPPGLPADHLARDEDLANRTRSAAADLGTGTRTDADALAAFLSDEERVAAIRREAREEARERAEQWGLRDALVESMDEQSGVDGFRGGGMESSDTGRDSRTPGS